MSEGVRKHIPIKERPSSQRPREKLFDQGSQECSLQELLAILIGSGYRDVSALQLAEKLLEYSEFSLRRLSAISSQDIRKEIKGIGLAKVSQIKAGLEIGKRLLAEEHAENYYQFRTPLDIVDYVYHYLGPEYETQTQESFFVILVNTRNKPFRRVRLTIGTIDTCLVDPQEVVRTALRFEATGIVLVHNHPSGETDPSPEDISITERIRQALEPLKIRLLDHIIIGKTKEYYTSFADKGYF